MGQERTSACLQQADFGAGIVRPAIWPPLNDFNRLCVGYNRPSLWPRHRGSADWTPMALVKTSKIGAAPRTAASEPKRAPAPKRTTQPKAIGQDKLSERIAAATEELAAGLTEAAAAAEELRRSMEQIAAGAEEAAGGSQEQVAA